MMILSYSINSYNAIHRKCYLYQQLNNQQILQLYACVESMEFIKIRDTVQQLSPYKQTNFLRNHYIIV